MRAVVQRVFSASVEVDGAITGAIDEGLLVYLGVGHADEDSDVRYMAKKVANLRIFQGEDGRMRNSVLDTGGGVLVVSQFTLYGDVRKGRRPAFTDAGPPELARALYEQFIVALREQQVLRVQSGVFQAQMAVSSVVNGPVTLLIDSQRAF